MRPPGADPASGPREPRVDEDRVGLVLVDQPVERCPLERDGVEEDALGVETHPVEFPSPSAAREGGVEVLVVVVALFGQGDTA